MDAVVLQFHQSHGAWPQLSVQVPALTDFDWRQISPSSLCPNGAKSKGMEGSCVSLMLPDTV